MNTENTKAVPFLSDEAKPFNGHTPLPWLESDHGPYAIRGGREVISCKNKNDIQFAAHACNTFYEREAELARLRGLLEEAEKASTELADSAGNLRQTLVDAMSGEEFHRLADSITKVRAFLAKIRK